MSKSKQKDKKQSTFYYFYSVGCGFCKKAEPIVDELNKEGHNILKLDLAESDNQGLKQELEKKYNKSCGTPWFIEAETGNQVCGFREKDIIKKWVNGEDIPQPPRPKGPMPRPPFMGVAKKEETTWKKEYEKWLEENSHLPNLQTADQILERPRPKTEPPKPPNPQMTDEQLGEWGKEYDKWKEENGHLPNLQPAEAIITRIKAQNNPNAAQPQQPAVVNSQEVEQLKKQIANLSDSVKVLENKQILNVQDQWQNKVEEKLDILMKHLGVK
jgi:thiol-disulfide isomerase/thioredoxin